METEKKPREWNKAIDEVSPLFPEERGLFVVSEKRRWCKGHFRSEQNETKRKNNPARGPLLTKERDDSDTKRQKRRGIGK